MNRILFGLVLFFTLLVLGVKPVMAAGEFKADYNVEYAISPQGLTIVTQNVTLTNQVTNLYPKQYSILLDTTSVKNVIAYDDKGVISPVITQKDGKTTIGLVFNEKIVGIGRQLKFSLRFENRDIAQKHGSIWEINIPGVKKDADIDSYTVSLQVPPSLGSNAYMSPLPANGTKWTKEQMSAGGITAAYGNVQRFTVGLAYYLENPNITSKQTEIALPPDTAFQKVHIDLLDPKPAEVIKDKDGNWLARYVLTPSQKLDVQAKLTISTFIAPQINEASTVPPTSDYLKSDTYWETGDAQIQKLASTYQTPRQIYDYVVRTLSYDYSRVNQNPNRKGAVQAIANPTSAICLEFTDLFVAMARAAGIPAREVIGYAYTDNSVLRPLSRVADVLHAWPEYYDKERSIWIPVDPTWASTTGGVNYFDKLDFNHIAFTIRGVSSTYPFAAGSYRKNGRIGKDVQVDFAPADQNTPPAKLSVTFQIPKTITSGRQSKGQVVIDNTTGDTITHALIQIEGEPYAVAVSHTEPDIPPFGKVKIPVTIATGGYLSTGKERVTVTVNGEQTDFYLTIEPLYWLLVPVGVIFIIITVGAIVMVKSSPWKSHHKK